MKVEPIIIALSSGEVVIDAGYSVGQILEALEAARRAVLGVVLRPIAAPTDKPA